MDSVSGKTFPTINPVTEEKICDVAEGDKVSPVTEQTFSLNKELNPQWIDTFTWSDQVATSKRFLFMRSLKITLLTLSTKYWDTLPLILCDFEVCQTVELPSSSRF